MDYALLTLAVGNIALLIIGREEALPWLFFTCLATAIFVALRLAREGVLGRAFQAQIQVTPLWQIFGLGIALLAVEIIWASSVSSQEFSIPIRRALGLISFSFLLGGVEIALFRKSNVKKTLR